MLGMSSKPSSPSPPAAAAAAASSCCCSSPSSLPSPSAARAMRSAAALRAACSRRGAKNMRGLAAAATTLLRWPTRCVVSQACRLNSTVVGWPPLLALTASSSSPSGLQLMLQGASGGVGSRRGSDVWQQGWQRNKHTRLQCITDSAGCCTMVRHHQTAHAVVPSFSRQPTVNTQTRTPFAHRCLKAVSGARSKGVFWCVTQAQPASASHTLSPLRPWLAR